MKPSFMIGIDGGGSHSTAILVGAKDKLQAQAEGGALNPLTVGWDGFRKNFRSLLDKLLTDVPREKIQGVCAGLAGVGVESVRRQAQAEISKLLPGPEVRVITDAQAALWGAFQGEAGVLLIAGTGSICLGMDDQGRMERVGGFGRLLGDEGSGYWIGLEALRQTLVARDGSTRPSTLEEFILKEFELHDIREIIPLVNSGELGPEKIADLARKVLSMVQIFSEARTIVRHAGDNLAYLVFTVCWRLDLKTPRIALSGGLWNSPGKELQTALKRTFAARRFKAKLTEPLENASWGAVRLLQKGSLPE